MCISNVGHRPPTEYFERDYPKIRILFIRHGQTQLNQEKRINGWQDEPMNKNGWREVAGIANKIPKNFGNTVFISPLRRTRETLKCLIRHQAFSKKIKVVELEELKERHFGDLTGLTWPEAIEKTKDPDLLKKDRLMKFDYRAFGGESGIQFKERVRAGIFKIRSTPVQGYPIVITHGGVIRLMNHSFVGISLSDNIGNASLHEIQFRL